MRLIDANALISDLEHDVERDMTVLDTLTLGRVSRESIQFDKDWKQNTIDLLMRAPTIEPETNWISCKERLPESYVDVLVWFEYYRYGSYNRLYQTHGIGTYSENYESWTINHESGWHKLRVIAWQPLPEPYREEGGEE